MTPRAPPRLVQLSVSTNAMKTKTAAEARRSSSTAACRFGAGGAAVATHPLNSMWILSEEVALWSRPVARRRALAC